ncbi:MAG: hypothetical protein ACH350_03885 [Parachlamydiaceae bacterium]
MYNVRITNFFTLHLLFSLLLASYAIGSIDTCQTLLNWPENSSLILARTERKKSRTAILIIAPPVINGGYVGHRWKLGKKVWEQYMNTTPGVDCYFVQSTKRNDKSRPDEVWIEGNTIYVGDAWYEEHGNDRILHKTIAAIEFLLPTYTHFIRTNLNTFINLNSVRKYTEKHNQSMYTGPVWEGDWFIYGYGLLFTSDVASHMAKEYRRLEGLELVDCDKSDDAVLLSLATGIYPFANPDSSSPSFCCCPTLPFGTRQMMDKELSPRDRINQFAVMLVPPISLKEAKQYCKQAPNSVMLYRIRDGLSIEELTELYAFLLRKTYKNISFINLRKYVESLIANESP